MKNFLDNHNEGDFVQGRIAYKSSNTCIVWCDNVIGKVINANDDSIKSDTLKGISLFKGTYSIFFLA